MSMLGRGLLSAVLGVVVLSAAGAPHAAASPVSQAARSRAAQSTCPDVTPSYDSACGPLFTTPQWSDQSGWDAPSQYQTIQLARLGAAKREDLIGRDSVGLWVERFDTATGQWHLLGSANGGVALSMPTSEGWDRPSQSSTIQTADLDGDGQYELLARAADGVHVYRWDPATDSFSDISAPPRLLSDATGGNQASVYETIQTADLLGDGHAELVFRTPQGIDYARFDPHTGHFGPVTRTGIAPDAHGGFHPSLYRTIQTGDVNGDGRPDLMLIAGGLRWYARGADGRYHEQPILHFGGLPGFDRPSQYETVRAVHFPGANRAVIMARERSGLRFFWFNGNTWLTKVPPLLDISDAKGFDSPSQYLTIRAGALTGPGVFDVAARTPTGITLWGLRHTEYGTEYWTKLSPGPALAGPVWDQPSHYETIRLGDITGDGHTALVARGVFGVRTFAWRDQAFRRPLPYSEFPAFSGAEGSAYAEVARLLLSREGDFRQLTYASPHEAITEATLNDYRSRLAERCTPLVLRRSAGGPPRYADCSPPSGSGVDPAAWTAVSNQVISELWAASGVVAHFTILEGIETKLFADQQGTLPALDTELTLPPNPPNRAPTFLKLTKASLDILKGLAEFFPVAGKIPHVLRAMALTGNALGAVADGLGLSSSPSSPGPYGHIVAEVAKLQQRERDITQAQRRYVLADYGLLMTVGAEVKGRLLTLDETAALSAGRQAFAVWVTQLYLPAYWRRYHVTRCRRGTDSAPTPIHAYVCDVPSGSFARVTGHSGSFTDFQAVLVGGSGCSRTELHEVSLRSCTWHSPAGATYSRVVDPVPSQCRYDPTPGSIAAWRYGCPYGVPAAHLIDASNGWDLPLTVCAANEGSCTNALKTPHSRAKGVTDVTG